MVTGIRINIFVCTVLSTSFGLKMNIIIHDKIYKVKNCLVFLVTNFILNSANKKKRVCPITVNILSFAKSSIDSNAVSQFAIESMKIKTGILSERQKRKTHRIDLR
jgi:hypothetical protein